MKRRVPRSASPTYTSRDPSGDTASRDQGVPDRPWPSAERDQAIVLEVLGQIHRGHPAGAELPLDSVPVGQGHGKLPGDRLHHGCEGPNIPTGLTSTEEGLFPFPGPLECL